MDFTGKKRTRFEEEEDRSLTIHVDWDIENCNGITLQISHFLHHLFLGLRARYECHFRTRVKVYQDSVTSVLNKKSLRLYNGKFIPLKTVLQYQGASFVDTAGKAPQQADSCIHRNMQVMQEDITYPQDHVYILVSSDGGFLPYLQDMKNHGFRVFLVANFDSISRSLLSTKWLNIWSYFTICRGDTDKMECKRFVRGYHPRKKVKYYAKTKDQKSDHSTNSLEIEF